MAVERTTKVPGGWVGFTQLALGKLVHPVRLRARAQATWGACSSKRWTGDHTTRSHCSSRGKTKPFPGTSRVRAASSRTHATLGLCLQAHAQRAKTWPRDHAEGSPADGGFSIRSLKPHRVPEAGHNTPHTQGLGFDGDSRGHGRLTSLRSNGCP